MAKIEFDYSRRFASGYFLFAASPLYFYFSDIFKSESAASRTQYWHFSFTSATLTNVRVSAPRNAGDQCRSAHAVSAFSVRIADRHFLTSVVPDPRKLERIFQEP